MVAIPVLESTSFQFVDVRLFFNKRVVPSGLVIVTVNDPSIGEWNPRMVSVPESDMISNIMDQLDELVTSFDP